MTTLEPLTIGKFAPDFTLNNQDSNPITLSELRGNNIILYFYPKDSTPGCTTEAIDFSTHLAEFTEHNTLILGLSKDSIESHQKFICKHELTITLLSDPEGTVCEAYDAWVEKNMYGKKYMGIQRCTFLIDNTGKITHIWNPVKVKGHAEEVLQAVKTLG